MPEFRFQRCLGRGGFGEVYRAVMSRGGGVEVDVAVKVLRADLDPTSQGVQRLRDEGRLLGRLTHPTILRVYDLVVIDGHAALVSEYVDGDDLARLLRQEAIPARAVYEAIAQVADALDAAWSWPSVTDGKPLHLVHRDIKPDNIRVEPIGTVKLLDFGIAQARAVRREAQTSVNIIMGSTQYLSPERLVQQEIGPEADVFALGCTLFEALTGEALFLRKSMRQMYLLMVEEQRFEAFVADRTETFRERLGGDRGIALVRAMTSWRKQNRPTAAEVAARCDMISDSTPGPTLAAWCRARTWHPPPEISGSLEGLTFLTSTSLGLDDPPAEPSARLPGPRAAPLPRQTGLTGQHGLTDELGPFTRDDTQRLELPERALDPTPDPAPSRWLAEDPTDARSGRRAPVLGELGHRPSSGDLELVAAVDPHAGPWSAAEMVALYASQDAAPPRTSAPPAPAPDTRALLFPEEEPPPPAPEERAEDRVEEPPAIAPPALPISGPVTPGELVVEADDEPPSVWIRNPPSSPVDEPPPPPLDDEPTSEGAEAPPAPSPATEEPSTDGAGALSTARLPLLMRQVVGGAAAPAEVAPVVAPEAAPVEGPTAAPEVEAQGQESTVRLQRRPKTRADGTPIPRRRLMAKPIQAPRFARALGADEPPRDTTAPMPRDTTQPIPWTTLEQQEAAQEPTLRMPAKRLLGGDHEDTWAGPLETAPTPSGAGPRQLRPGDDDKGIDEVPDAVRALAPPPPAPAPEPLLPPLPLAPVQASPPEPPTAKHPSKRPPPEEVTKILAPRDEPPPEEASPPSAEVRRRRSERSPLLAAGASLAALVLGVGVLLVILVVAWLLRG